MKFFKRLLVLLIVYRLAAASTFGIVTWYYKINLLENPDLQLYGGIAAGVLSLLTGLLLVIVKKKKKPVKTLPNETGKKIETASVVTPGANNGLMVDEIPQQPDLPAMPEYEPLEEEPAAEEIAPAEETVIEETEPETVPAEEMAEENVEETTAAEETVAEEPEIEMIPEPVIPEETAELVLEEPVFDDVPEKNEEDEVVDFMAATKTMPVILPEEETAEVTEEEKPETEETAEREAEQTEEIADNEGQPEEPEKVKKIFVDDTTQIISTASLNDYLKKIRENRDTEVANANAVKNDIILPLGPREAAVEEEIQAEKVIEEPVAADEVVTEKAEAPVAEMQPQQEEMVLRPLEDDEEKTTTLSRTQENYITQSTLSYIDESGKPQFRVTEEIKTVKEMDESQKKGFEGFDVKAERAEKWANFLNGIITILVIGLVLIILYYLYNRFFA
ncbi:MAG: hypothetical protein IKE77_06325 [Erysipelotrichaceae bacterium]|nr:hypothetical protein [Erysipelotrichaceae bacterium]